LPGLRQALAGAALAASITAPLRAQDSDPLWRWLGWTAEISGVPATSGASGTDATGGLITGPTFTVERWLVLDFGANIPLWGPSVRAWYAGATWNVGRL
jgi:hypothetical protein